MRYHVGLHAHNKPVAVPKAAAGAGGVTPNSLKLVRIKSFENTKILVRHKCDVVCMTEFVAPAVHNVLQFRTAFNCSARHLVCM